MPPLGILLGVGSYILVTAFYTLRWHLGGLRLYIALGVDIAVSSFVMVCTGGLQSPFLLFTGAPVLMAALFLGIKITASVVGLTAVYVIASQLFNPFFPEQQLSPQELNYYLVYMIVLCLVAGLPHLINVNLRQRLQYENILQERQRLSREIHDGAAQTVAALRWQVQLLSRHLAERGIDLNEVRELEKLAEEAQQDTRESLELLRNYTGDGSFLPHLRDYLEHLKQATNIAFRLDAETNGLRLEAVVELELLRICQEALANIRKHSDAHNVRLTVQRVNGHVKVSIADDGQGFDAVSFYHNGNRSKSHGIKVMQERAQSVGGKCRVLSFPGQGTEIQVEMPTNGHGSRSSWET